MSRRALQANSVLYKSILDAAKARVCPNADSFEVCLRQDCHRRIPERNLSGDTLCRTGHQSFAFQNTMAVPAM